MVEVTSCQPLFPAKALSVHACSAWDSGGVHTLATTTQRWASHAACRMDSRAEDAETGEPGLFSEVVRAWTVSRQAAARPPLSAPVNWGPSAPLLGPGVPCAWPQICRADDIKCEKVAWHILGLHADTQFLKPLSPFGFFGGVRCLRAKHS